MKHLLAGFLLATALAGLCGCPKTDTPPQGGEKASAGETPLSDLIAEYLAADTPENYQRFLTAFRRARVGVFVLGLPEGATGEFVTTKEHPVSLGMTNHGDGRSRAMVFADPPTFAQKFGQKFNAEMSAEELLAAALSNPACEGVLVNSATAEVSVVISRQTAAALLGVPETPGRAEQKP
jgi:hypothetical protein